MLRTIRYVVRSRHVRFSTLGKVWQKSALLNDVNIEQPKSFQDRNDLLNIPEQLRSQNCCSPTRAQNQLDTMVYYDLLASKGFDAKQSELIIELLLEILNDEFFSSYNKDFLRNMELDTQSHLFNAAETELKFAIQNSRDTHLNDQHLQLMKLLRDVDSLHDEINEMIINLLQKDSKVDFNNQKIENTLLQRQIKMELNNCTHKITTKILGNTRSDIENLRWQTTRSGLLAILVLVFLVMGGASFSKRIAASNLPVQVTLRTLDPEETDYDEDGTEEEEEI